MRSSILSRGSFLAAAGAAAMSAAAAAADAAPPLSVPAGLRAGNARAALIAASSPLVAENAAKANALAASIGDAQMRSRIQDVLERPVPRYAAKYPTAEARSALRDRLARAGFMKPDAPVAGIFPPGTEDAQIVQPFWSAAGSDLDSHHSYPGGLLAHELFNATIAAQYRNVYDALYFDGGGAVDRDTVIAAAFMHDIMKTVVFQFNDDGTLLREAEIAATGAHHCLSGAEAILRGFDARFVTVLLSAHAAPSLGDEAKVTEWCRAAAMIAGVDAVEYGLVAKRADGYVLAAPAPIEAFVSHLSDHDYVLTIPAVRAVVPQIATIDPSPWYRHRVLATHSAVALYGALTKNKLAETLRG